MRASGIAHRRGEEERAKALFLREPRRTRRIQSAMGEQPLGKSVCIDLRYSLGFDEDLELGPSARPPIASLEA